MRAYAKRCIIALAAVLASVVALDAQAANKKPNNNAPQAQQRAAQQRQAQSQQQQSAALVAQQEALKREQAGIMAKFDKNKNGKIDTDEKPPFEQYMRAKGLGKKSNAAKLTKKK